MSYPFRRASARLAVGLVAAAVPLVGASVAQAAMAGANPLVTTSRPDLRSVSLTGASSAQFCFDKAITSVPNVGGFYLGGYRADAFLASTNAVAAGNCVNASFPTSVSGNTDNIEHHSFGQVAEGAVRTTGNLGNRADSTALTGSISNNGTRGLTTAPDLTGVSVVTSGTQQIAFTYDQNVNPNAIVGTAGFHFATANGTDIPSQTASVSTTDPKTVIAQFPVGNSPTASSPVTPLVSNAVRAYSIAGAVQSQTVEHTLGTFDSQAIPGSSGITSGTPDLVSAVYSRQPGNATGGTALLGGATLGSVLGTGFGGTGFSCGTAGSNSCVVVDYTFNEGVNLPLLTGTLQTALKAATSNFYAYLSDGSFVHPAAVYEPSGTQTIAGVGGNTLAVGGSTTVRAIFPTANQFDEYLVKAGVTGPMTGNGGTPLANRLCALTGSVIPTCAVVSSTTLNPNTTGSAPIGGNAGAFASGFSTAPDAFRVTFDTQTNTAQVLFDQRVFRGSNLSYVLLDGNGNAIASASGVSGFATGSTDPLALGLVTLSFPSPAVQVGNAKALEIRGSLGASAVGTFAAVGGSFFNGANFNPGPGLSPADYGNVQQILSPAATSAYTHLRAGKVKSHKRMTWAYLHSVLVKELHKTSKKSKKSKHHR